MSAEPDHDAVRRFLQDYQDRLCAALEGCEMADVAFRREEFELPNGGSARPRVLEGGEVIEKAAVHCTDTRGKSLPPAATERRPELAGHAYQALSVSTIVHPRNPYAPTSHSNIRFFSAQDSERVDNTTWWIGGGFDLTPYYGFDEDAIAWHRAASRACDTLGAGHYTRFKKACDEYFFLRHRGEPRGIGGIFFDDLDTPDFVTCFAFLRAVGEAFLETYAEILERRRGATYGDRERDFQLYRRGRYAEFNLVWDRGTRFGLESGGRVESILASLPPAVRWIYDYHAEPGSAEAELLTRYLKPRDWLALARDAAKTS